MSAIEASQEKKREQKVENKKWCESIEKWLGRQGCGSFPYTYGSLCPSRCRGLLLGVPQVMIVFSAISMGSKL